MKLRSVKDVNITGKQVILHVDYNTPLKLVSGKRIVADDTRIRLTLPTLQYLLNHQAKIIIISHAGRPDGKVVPELRLDPMAQRLHQLIGRPVKKLNHIIGPQVTSAVNAMKPSDILMLENIRFHPGQTKNDLQLAHSLAKLAQLVVNDAFPASHRAHSSISAITKFLPMVAGFQLLLEVKMLSRLMEQPKRPFVAIVGGAKVSDKVDAIQNLARLSDAVLVGGGVANNFLKADGIDVLNSYLQDVVADEKKRGISYVEFARTLLKTYRSRKILLENYIPVPKIVYPVDVIAANSLNSPKHIHRIKLIDSNQKQPYPRDLMFLDIGPATIRLYKQIINQARTVFWNGPMGVYEQPQFTTGTKTLALAIAKTSATTILGGGDTLAAVSQYKLETKYDFVSTAGGASLEFLAGKSLPGLEPMRMKG